VSESSPDKTRNSLKAGTSGLLEASQQCPHAKDFTPGIEEKHLKIGRPPSERAVGDSTCDGLAFTIDKTRSPGLQNNKNIIS
jgi:hypothetical protein